MNRTSTIFLFCAFSICGLSGCNKKHEKANSVNAENVITTLNDFSSLKYSSITNYVGIMTSTIDIDCERYMLRSQFLKTTESRPIFPESYDLGHSSFCSNIVQFFSCTSDLEDRKFFFMKLEVELESKQIDLTKLQQPLLIHPIEMFGEMITNAELNKSIEKPVANSRKSNQAEIKRYASNETDLLRLQIHYRNIFYNELLYVLTARKCY